jgi:hypothetical protein
VSEGTAIWRVPPRQLLKRGVAGSLSAHAAPAEPHERIWQGELVPDGHGGFELRSGSSRWMLITLEPSLQHWLKGLERGREVELIGCANPWGPWLRVSRLAEPS